MKRIALYLAEAIYFLPRTTFEAYQLYRWKGVYLVLCSWVFRGMPLPLTNTPWGKFHSWSEAMNFIDNFAMKELRCEEVEQAVKMEDAPVVIDLGVNVGITIRWWLALSPKVSVIGVDMIQEALDFTTSRIASADQTRWIPICGAIGKASGDTRLYFDDPLEGTSNLHTKAGKHVRNVTVKPLDQWLGNQLPKEVTLLKIDIEGYGATALQGADELLARTRYVVLEVHDGQELADADRCLSAKGFHVLAFHGRTIWWKRST
jgi:FkbM family methyltransferase